MKYHRREAQPMQGSSSMVPYLPLEVITQILEKLAVKNLLKLKVVCKLWCSLISSDQFVRKHLSMCASNTQRIIMDDCGLLYDLGFYSVNGSVVLNKSSIDIRIGGHDRFTVMGSCDGLVCLKEGASSTMLLWNPSTRDFKVLSSPSQVEGVHMKGQDNSLWRYGFGYDCNSDDYKMLTLLPSQAMYGSYKSILYSLRSNSWTRIQDSPSGFFDNTCTFVGGALHWTAAKGNWIDEIVSFDLASETYKEVPLPHPDMRLCNLQLGASRGCLCLLADIPYESKDIWVMKEYGVPESWTKTSTIPSTLGTSGYTMTLKPLTWSVEDGEILLYANGNLVSYNVNKILVLQFASDDVKTSCSYHLTDVAGVGYEESLVSPNAYNSLRANKICPLNIEIVLRKLSVKYSVWRL